MSTEENLIAKAGTKMREKRFVVGAFAGFVTALVLVAIFWIISAVSRGHGISLDDFRGWELTVIVWHMLWMFVIGLLSVFDA